MGKRGDSHRNPAVLGVGAWIVNQLSNGAVTKALGGVTVGELKQAGNSASIDGGTSPIQGGLVECPLGTYMAGIAAHVGTTAQGLRVIQTVTPRCKEILPR